MIARNCLLLIILCTGINGSVSALSADKQLRAKELELSNLKKFVEMSRDSLQMETVDRYSFKQQMMEQREVDKEEFERQKDVQGQNANELSQIREEVLVLTQQLDEQKKNTELQIADWNAVKATLEDLFAKEADALQETFMTDRIFRQGRFESIRRELALRLPSQSLEKFIAYKMELVREGQKVKHYRDKIMLDNGLIAEVSVLQFGNVFAYGIDTASSCYIIRQTGSIGAEKFIAAKIDEPVLNTFILNSMHIWIEQKKVEGTIMLDLLQNDQSRLIIAGKKESFIKRTVDSIKEDGAIMIPLLLLPLWVIYILIKKSYQIFRRKSLFTRQYKYAMKLIEAGKFDEALAYCNKSKSAMARILQACIEMRNSNRNACERVVREIIYHEVPIVNRGINTMAVIAGAAPLVGLLGTISGMITLFAAVTHFGTGDPKFLAGGISEALVTAKTGLAVAIPALFFHDFLRSGKEKLIATVDESTTHLLNFIWPEG